MNGNHEWTSSLRVRGKSQSREEGLAEAQINLDANEDAYADEGWVYETTEATQPFAREMVLDRHLLQARHVR